MRVNYDDIVLTPHQKAVYIRTIEQNPFIPSNNLLKTKLYDKQIYALTSTAKRKLLGGSAYSGKSRYGATSALQWFEFDKYRCLIVRRTYDDVIATGGIVDYLDQWLDGYKFVEHNQSKRVFINHNTDAKIYYNYMLYEEDRKKFKSRAYNKIIVDEASEILKPNLQYLNRSLRPTEADKRIPLTLEYISNPDFSGGIEYLKKKFVSKKAEYPYYEMNFWDNPFVDPEDYKETLSELSTADYEFQMGNWDYQLQSGDIFDNNTIIKSTITQEHYEQIQNEHELQRIIRGWDIAASDTATASYTATTLIEVYKNGPKIATKQESFRLQPGRLENRMRMIMDNDGDEVEQLIEKQPAAAGKIMKRYWAQEFSEYNIEFVPVFKNKIIRASKIVPYLKNESLLLYDDKNEPWLKDFTRQAINFPQDKIKDDDPESLHDDRIDSLSLIINHLAESAGPKIRFIEL